MRIAYFFLAAVSCTRYHESVSSSISSESDRVSPVCDGSMSHLHRLGVVTPSIFLSLLTCLLRVPNLDFSRIRAQIRADMLDNSSSDSDLDQKIRSMNGLLATMSAVPAWFHFLHMRSFPELPSIDSIKQNAPVNYPIQDPAVLHLISSVWLKFCIHGYSHPSSPCSFSLSIPVHGKLQPGFFLRKEPYHRLIRELFIKESNKRRSDVPDIVHTAEIFKDEKEMEMLESFYGLRPNDKIWNESEREAFSAFTNSWHGVENAEK